MSSSSVSDSSKKGALWSSQLVFLLAAIGSAVGLGNIWRFPYLSGTNGGGFFILVYLISGLFVGLPVLIAELMLGRMGQGDPVSGLCLLVKKYKLRKFWLCIGWMGLIIAFFLLSYYYVIAGWTLRYMFASLFGSFNHISAAHSKSFFTNFIESPWCIFWYFIFVVITGFISMKGLNDGIEKAVTFMMPLLFIVFICLIAYAATMSGFSAGMKFMFWPDLSNVEWQKVIPCALGQAFFSLSIGIGVFLVYGSYLGDDVSLIRSGTIIWFSDTLVAILAGMIIFPFVFTYHLPVAEGPGLTFVTLPVAFGQMKGGAIVGALFFFLLAIAALTSTISVFEPLVAWMTNRGISRSSSSIIMSVLLFVVGLLSAFSFSFMKDVHPLFFLSAFKSSTFFGILDYVVGNIAIVVSGLLIALICGWCLSRDTLKKEFLLDGDEANKSKYAYFFHIWYFFLKYVTPIALIIVLVFNLFWD